MTIIDAVLENSVANGRCVNTRTDEITVTLKDCTIIADNTSSNTQPITVGGADTNRLTLNIENCQIDAGRAGYGIIVFVPADINITDSTVKGYAATYLKPGSEGTKFVVKGSTLEGSNYANDPTSDFGTLAFETSGSSFTFDEESHVIANQNGTSAQTLICKADEDLTHNIYVYGQARTDFENEGYMIDRSGRVYGTDPILFTPDNCTLVRTGGDNPSYANIISGDYLPANGEVSFEIREIAHETDGGRFATVVDKFTHNGNWEATVHIVGSAGGYNPSVLDVILSVDGQEVTRRTLPIVLVNN